MSWNNPDLLVYTELVKILEAKYTDQQTILTRHRLPHEDYNYHLGQITALREIGEELKRLHKEIFGK